MKYAASSFLLSTLLVFSGYGDPQEPKENRAIYFDGVDDYIDLGDIYDDLELPVTISAWIWLDPNAAEGSIPIFDSQDGLPAYSGLSFLTSTASVLAVQYGDGRGQNNAAYRRAKSATFGPIAGRWVNFTAVVRGAKNMELFFNGVNVGGFYAGESGLPMNSNSPRETAKIGMLSQNGTVLRFKGKLDELRIWERSLPTDEIQQVIFSKIDRSHPGLIGYWNFDEPGGDVVIDQSINNYEGILKGSPSRVLSEVPVR